MKMAGENGALKSLYLTRLTTKTASNNGDNIESSSSQHRHGQRVAHPTISAFSVPSVAICLLGLLGPDRARFGLVVFGFEEGVGEEG